MTAATKPRTITAQLGYEVLPAKLRVPLKANTVAVAGTMAAIDSSGYGVAVTEATGLTVLGVWEQSADNTGGASGDKVVEVRRGAFKFANSASGDLITQAEFTKQVYAADNQTVAKTSNSSARSVAGRVIQVEDDGVIVQFGGFF
jgi:hypothetical protein